MGHIYLVRHGQSEWNVANKICGSTDIPLTGYGHEQAQETAELIRREKLKIDEIISSPLLRARETAEHIANVNSIPMRIDNRLIEQSYGKWEGTPRHSIEFSKDHECFAKTYDGGESILHVAQRVYNLLDEIREESNSRTYLLVAHNGIAKMVHSYFNDMTNEEYAHYRINNCEVVRYDFK